MSTLQIKNLHVQVATNDGPKPILKGVDLTIDSNQVHAIMGPNGSGKSTLAYSIAGHPDYEVTDGEVLLDGVDLLEMSVDERARAGLFLAMQYPVEVPGVTVANFLRTAKTSIDGEAPKVRQWVGEVNQAMKNLRMDPAFSQRDVNAGFSGGEKKRFEILQMELLRPRFAVLDETDSGLDVDALRIVSEASTASTTSPTPDSSSSPTTRASCATSSPTTSTSSSTGAWPRPAAPTWPTVWRRRATTATSPDRSHPCRSRRRRVAHVLVVVGPGIEEVGLRFLVTSAPSLRRAHRAQSASNRKGTS